jgi:tetratricopeptide (TPR) repeat protein
MLSQEQLIGYLEGTLSAAERAQVEGLLADDPAAQRQLAEQRGLDQALHVLLGDATSNEQVKQSILAVVRAAPAEQLKARVLEETSGAQLTGVGTPARWIAKLLEWASGTWAAWGSQSVRAWELVRRLSAAPARRWAFATVSAALVLAACFFWLRPSPAPVEIGKFISVMGAPKVQHRGERSTLNPQPSALVYLGDRIETGDADKAELQFHDGTRLSLNFNTTIQIPSPESRARGPTPVARPRAVRLLLGQLSSKVQAATNQADFAVHTPVATAAVRGTEFGLNVRRAWTNTSSQSAIRTPQSAMPLVAVLTVKAGRVEFFNAFGKVQVTAMTESTARSDSAPTEPRRLSILKRFRLTDAHILNLRSLRITLVGMSNTKRWVFPNAAPALSVQELRSNTVVVAAIHERTAADRAGIQVGDIIAAINGRAVRHDWPVRAAWAVGVGQPLTLTLRRDGDERQVTMTPELQSAPALPKLLPEVEQPLYAATRRLIEQALEIWEETPRGKAAVAEGERELLRLHAQFPNEAAVLNNLGVLYESRDMVGKAIQQYQRAVNLAPEVGLYHFNLGYVLQNIGNVERAMEEIQMAMHLEPRWLGAWLCPVSVYTDQLAFWDRPEEALAATETALSANPGSGLFWSTKGILLQRLGRLEEARDAVLKAVECEPSEYGNHETLGDIYRQLRQFDRAEKALKRAIELYPRLDGSYNELASLYQEMGRWSEAEALYRQAWRPQALVNLGGLYHQRQNYSDAETTFRRALQASPDSYDAYVGLGRALWKQGKGVEAEAALRKAIELEPSDHEAYIELGRLYADRNQLQDAETMHRKALELYPDSPSAAAALAEFLDTHGRPGKAEGVLRSLLKTSPNDPQVLNRLAYFLAVHGQQLDEALALAQRALQAQPDNPDFLDTLGWTQFKQGEVAAAEETLKKAIAAYRENPKAAAAWQHLAAVYEAKGDQLSAADAYRRALKLQPDSKEAVEALQRLGP